MFTFVVDQDVDGSVLPVVEFPLKGIKLFSTDTVLNIFCYQVSTFIYMDWLITHS